MRRATMCVVLVLAGCGGPTAVDDAVTERIAQEESCEVLREGMQSRAEDLAQQEAGPAYGMTPTQIELAHERVAAAEERMDELGC